MKNTINSKRELLHAIGCGSDFTVQNGGSVCILRAHTDEAQDWIDNNIGNNETQHFGGGIIVEPRYLADIVDALINEGFTGKEI